MLSSVGTWGYLPNAARLRALLTISCPKVLLTIRLSVRDPRLPGGSVVSVVKMPPYTGHNGSHASKACAVLMRCAPKGGFTFGAIFVEASLNPGTMSAEDFVEN